MLNVILTFIDKFDNIWTLIKIKMYKRLIVRTHRQPFTHEYNFRTPETGTGQNFREPRF